MGEMRPWLLLCQPLSSWREGSPSLERDAGSTCTKLCDPVTRRRGGRAGTERRVLLVRSGTTVRHSGQRLGGEDTGRRCCHGRRCSTVTLKKTARIRRRVCSIPFQQISNNLYCEGWMESLLLLLDLFHPFFPTLTVKCC